MNSCAKLTVNNPKNVTGPTKAVDIDTNKATKINKSFVIFSYDTPKLID